MNGMTTISIKKETRALLAARKAHKNQSYDEILCIIMGIKKEPTPEPQPPASQG